MGMGIVHTQRDGAAGGGFGFCVLAQPVADRGQGGLGGAIARRQLNRPAQLLLAAGKISKLMQHQAEQTAQLRAIMPRGKGMV